MICFFLWFQDGNPSPPKGLLLGQGEGLAVAKVKGTTSGPKTTIGKHGTCQEMGLLLQPSTAQKSLNSLPAKIIAHPYTSCTYPEMSKNVDCKCLFYLMVLCGKQICRCNYASIIHQDANVTNLLFHLSKIKGFKMCSYIQG